MPDRIAIRMTDTGADEDVVYGDPWVLANGTMMLVLFNDDDPRCDAVAAFDRCREVARKHIAEQGVS